MIRAFLTSTAIVAMASTSAFASSKTTTPAEHVEIQKHGIFEFEIHTLAPTSTTGFLASNMIGKSVMTGETDQAEAVGDINDVIIGRDGSVRAVVVGVGGFLGIGEKEVAVDMSRLTFVTESADQFKIISDVSRGELENAKAFERPDHIPDWMSTDAVRSEIDKLAQSTEETYEKVRTEAIDPMKKRIDETMKQAWTAEKTQINAATVSTDLLIGSEVYTSQDTNIGEVSQVLIGEDGQAQAVVVEVGGFLGFGEKPVAVAYSDLMMFETETGGLLVTAPFTKEQLEKAKTFVPEDYKTNPVHLTVSG